MTGHPSGTESSSRLLVSGCQHDEVAGEADICASKDGHGHCACSRYALGITATATEHLPISDHAGEGWVGPSMGVFNGYDVQM